ncbi:MAG: DHH family phosphoesterase, partial [Clostridia bacterium]|nr:DHH family phosphoesterase [Clostridia bacterium]
MFDKRWIVLPEHIYGKDSTVEQIKADLLRVRGIAPEDAAAFFAAPVLPPVPEDEALEAAVDIILAAVDDGLRISIFGDYDCDGICATAILYHFLKNVAGADVDYCIPDRFGEGYGITPAAVERLCEQGTGLIVTVDNGISALEAAARADELGVAMVITDHHLAGEELPMCGALVDPHLPDSTFGYRDECGAGVAFTLVRKLGEELGVDPAETEGYITAVAIATIGDSVPLTGTNRIYVRLGLEAMANLLKDPDGAAGPLDCGVLALLESCGFNETLLPGSTDISFKAAPKINAAGRLGSGERAIHLFLAPNRAEAEKAAETLAEENRTRKVIEQDVYTDALRPGRLLTGPADALTLSAGEDWHPGVIGIVASQLADKFLKPAIALTVNVNGDDPLYKGSGRSVRGFDLFKALSACSGHLERFGGHAMAVGISIYKSQLEPFLAAFNAYCAGLDWSLLPARQSAEVDAAVSGELLTPEFS